MQTGPPTMIMGLLPGIITRDLPIAKAFAMIKNFINELTKCQNNHPYRISAHQGGSTLARQNGRHLLPASFWRGTGLGYKSLACRG